MPTEPLRIATINVNGIRAAFRKGMGAWLDSRDVDILAMQEVRASTEDLQGLLGDDWVKRHVAKIKQFSDSYKRLAWGPVLATLPENRTVEMSAEEVKDRFEKFSEGFERAYGKQGACVVPDVELREEIKLSIARKLVPVYREFYNTRRSVILAGAGGVTVVRFTPDDIENHLSNLFSGEGISGSSSVSSPSSCRSRQSTS